MWENRLSCEPCACGPSPANALVADRVASCSLLGGLRRCSVERRQLPFRSMAKQILAQRLSQISTRASILTVWAGFVRRACLTKGSSVYSQAHA